MYFNLLDPVSLKNVPLMFECSHDKRWLVLTVTHLLHSRYDNVTLDKQGVLLIDECRVAVRHKLKNKKYIPSKHKGHGREFDEVEALDWLGKVDFILEVEVNAEGNITLCALSNQDVNQKAS